MKFENSFQNTLVFSVLINTVSINRAITESNITERKSGLLVLPLIKQYSDQNDALEKNNYESRRHYLNAISNEYTFINDNNSTRFRVTDDDDQPQYEEGQELLRAFRAVAARRIVGGLETRISVYPYNVAISKSGKHWCGGSIIDEQWVLTAGHCLESAYDGTKSKLQPFVIRAGSSFHGRGGYQAKINKVFFPPKYAPGSADYDFALLRLDRPLPIGRNIAVLNLPSKEYVVQEEDVVVVTGWGSTDESGYGHIPDRLQFVPVPIISPKDCQKSYRFYITPRMLCAGYESGGKDACNHDSGGPAVRDGVLLGVVSFGGKKCGDPGAPGVYSRVSQLTEWVQNIITANEAFNTPELKPKIKKLRQRETKIKKFQSRVESKKNAIKNWLKSTFNWNKFLRLAKRKMVERGTRSRRMIDDEPISLKLNNDLGKDGDVIDEINFDNQIKERIIDGGLKTDYDMLLHALALEEAVYSMDIEK